MRPHPSRLPSWPARQLMRPRPPGPRWPFPLTSGHQMHPYPQARRIPADPSTPERPKRLPRRPPHRIQSCGWARVADPHAETADAREAAALSPDELVAGLVADQGPARKHRAGHRQAPRHRDLCQSCWRTSSCMTGLGSYSESSGCARRGFCPCTLVGGGERLWHPSQGAPGGRGPSGLPAVAVCGQVDTRPGERIG